MKCNTIKTGAMLGRTRLSARISENRDENLPNDFGKS
jgi:hypothetical protein